MDLSGKKGYVKPPLNPHQEPYVDELNSLLESLHEHDDRSLVLTLGAFAEDSLERLLLVYLREPKQAKELVNGFNAPLGTFSARIKAAFVFGLIRNDVYRTLELLRRIRNEFAHNWSGVSLDREDISRLINQLPLSRREEYALSNTGPCEASFRERLTEKVSDVLIDVRMLAKSLDKSGTKAPLIMTHVELARFELVEVKQLNEE